MNQNTIAPVQQQDENHLIAFWPRERCFRCSRLTNVALLDVSSPVTFMPCCPLHGYASSYSLTPSVREHHDELESISRFVTWMHGDQGRCPLVGSIVIENVPGFDLSLIDPLKFEPLSWLVRYEQPDGVRVDVHVTWSIDESCFSLYEGGQLQAERPSEDVLF